MSLRNVRIVLVRPQGSANVGSVARAMKNMGLDDLALVQPAIADTLPAEVMAVHAADVLAARRVFPNLAAAVADCGLVVGTTAHAGPYRQAARTPRAAAHELVAAAAGQRVALVFGPEDHGLSNDDLKHCPQVLTIPTAAAYTSLNLAQAVLVCCYELFLATAQPVAATPPRVTADQSARLFIHLEAALQRIGFLKADSGEHIMYSLRRMLGTLAMDERDLRIWLGIARQIEWYADNPTGSSDTANP